MTKWPEGVIARYLTVGGATVDLTDLKQPRRVSSHCLGCTAEYDSYWENDESIFTLAAQHEMALQSARAWAQDHASTCHALPKPE